MTRTRRRIIATLAFIAPASFCLLVYWPGLHGSWLFDDYPNIVNNPGLHPEHVNVGSLVNVALSSPASEFKRPLSSLSFAANYFLTGLDPFAMKLTNLCIHLLNGLLVYLLSQQLLRATLRSEGAVAAGSRASVYTNVPVTSAVIAFAWMMLPVNLTGVLYVVQRMESLANVFVLAGLLSYVAGRQRMLRVPDVSDTEADRSRGRGFGLCVLGLLGGTAVGLLVKETAVMLPLYACMVEVFVFRFHKATMVDTLTGRQGLATDPEKGLRLARPSIEYRIAVLFLLLLALPLAVGLAWLAPQLAKASSWAARDFTLGTRLLTEARVVTDYIFWCLAPSPDALSFYHDDVTPSTGLLAPWTTLASIVVLVGLAIFAARVRRSRPLLGLGISLFLACHLLTGTVLPLELIYEHRNYFASFGLLLALISTLLPSRGIHLGRFSVAASRPWLILHSPRSTWPSLMQKSLLVVLLIWWSTLTAVTAYDWGDELRLARMLAARAPKSSRAQYELGRLYIIKSKYNPHSPYTTMAYPPLERAAAMPDASILPEQALIFMNSRMDLPVSDAWWESLIAKLAARKPGAQDESSMDVLTRCDREGRCNLPTRRMIEAYEAALAHPKPSARLMALYGDYAWSVLDDRALGLKMTKKAVAANPNESVYKISLIRMLVADGHCSEALSVFKQLELMNVAGRLDPELVKLRKLLNL